MNWMDAFPPALQQELRTIENICDVRMLSGRKCVITTLQGEMVTHDSAGAQEIYDTAQALSHRMLRLSPESTGAGFITLHGGHRMGLCGRVTIEGNALVLREIGSLCLRIAREVPGCGKDAARAMMAHGRVMPTLIVGPPGSGKTTLLRDTIRILSDAGIAVGLCDERSEVAACLQGVPQLDVGMRTHVLDGCHKADGLRWLLRAMCPQLLAMDELYGAQECAAVREAAACGVPMLATLHAGSGQDVCRREGVMRLLLEGAFSQIIFVKDRRVALVSPVSDLLEKVCCAR